MAIQGTKIESPIMKAKEEPKKEMPKRSNKDTLFNMLKKAQTYGVHLGAHVNNPHMYNGLWMDGVSNVAELTEVLANYDQTTTAMMIFNLLFPFEGKLPIATNDDNSIPELFGFKKIASEPRVDYKKEAETVKKELDLANQNISKMTISVAQLEAVNTSLSKDSKQQIQSLEKQLASLNKTVTQLQNKPKIITTDYSLQVSVSLTSMEVQASPLTEESECQCEIVLQAPVEKDESMSVRSIPNEDSVQMYEIQMIQVLRAIMRMVDRNLVSFEEGNYVDQLAKMLGSVGTENAQDIAELLFPIETVKNPLQAISCIEMVHEDACSYMSSLLYEAELAHKMPFFDLYRSKNIYQITLKMMEDDYPTISPKKLEDLFNLVNFNGDEFITIEKVNNISVDEMKYCLNFWFTDIVVVDSHTYILNINDTKSNQLLSNSEWNDTISCSNSAIRIQLNEQNGGDCITKSTLDFTIDTRLLNQTVEIGSIQFTTPPDTTILATAYFKYVLLPIENIHKQIPVDVNNKIEQNRAEEIKVNQENPLAEETKIDTPEQEIATKESQLNENEPDTKDNCIPSIPIAKEEVIDEAIISSNIEIDDEKTNVITHSSRDQLPSIKKDEGLYEHGCIVLKDFKVEDAPINGTTKYHIVCTYCGVVNCTRQSLTLNWNEEISFPIENPTAELASGIQIQVISQDSIILADTSITIQECLQSISDRKAITFNQGQPNQMIFSFNIIYKEISKIKDKSKGKPKLFQTLENAIIKIKVISSIGIISARNGSFQKICTNFMGKWNCANRKGRL